MESLFLSMRSDIRFRYANNCFNTSLGGKGLKGLAFNDPMNIGSMARLSDKLDAESIERFEQSYYASGDELVAKLQKYPEAISTYLLDPMKLMRDGLEGLKALTDDVNLTKELKELLISHGRPKQYFDVLAQMFQIALSTDLSFNEKIPASEHFNEQESGLALRTFIFFNSYRGAAMEIKVIKYINDKYPNIIATKASAIEDMAEGVDIVLDNQFGIQVKPLSYFKSHQAAVDEQRELNEEKNAKSKMAVGLVAYDHNGKVFVDKDTKEYIIEKEGAL